MGTPANSMSTAQAPDASGAGRHIGRFLLAGALAVLLIRLMAPLQIGKDQAQQLEAGMRFAAGAGITGTSAAKPAGPDITPDPEPRKLTQWPPGLSVTIAGFLRCGIPLLVSLKLLGAGLTLAGWLGWMRWSQPLLAELHLRPPSRTIVFLASFLTPLLYTPLWSGTDIFLWAGVPWVLLLLTRPAGAPRPIAAAAMAGILVGLCFWFRYAGAFLGLVGVLVLLYLLWPDWRALLGRIAAFGGTSTLLALPVLVFMKTDYVPLSDVYDAALDAGETSRILSTTHHTIRLIFGTLLPEAFLARWNWQPAFQAAGMLSLLALLAAPVLAALRMPNSPARTRVVILLILPAALIVFLAAVSRGFFLGVPRYYEPVQLCWVLAALVFLGGRGGAAWGARLIAALFAVHLLGVTPLRALRPEGRESVIRLVAGYVPSRAASLHSTSVPVSFFEPGRLFAVRAATREKIQALYQAHPEALFWAENYPLYIYDGWPGGPQPGAALRPLPPLPYLLKAYSPRDRTIFAVLERTGEADFAAIQWPGQVLYKNTWEQTEIREIHLAAGQPVLRLPASTDAAGSTHKESR